jgi:NTP pyrophosphatase (non-canonical NTP hydrolase)
MVYGAEEGTIMSTLKALSIVDAFDYLEEQNIKRCESSAGFGHAIKSWSIAEWTNAAAGEMGEACNIAKKILRFRDGVAGNKKSEEEYRKDLAAEFADVIIYLSLAAAHQNIDLGEAVIDAFNNKSAEISSDIKL